VARRPISRDAVRRRHGELIAMTATPSPADSPTPPPLAPSSARPRRLLLAAAVAAGLAVVGGVAGAVAGVVSRSSSSPSSPVRGSGASLYFPAIGAGGAQSPGQQGGSTGGAGVADSATSMRSTGGMAAGAPVPLAINGAAYAQMAPSIAYPYAGGCGEPTAAQVQGDGVTATGMAQVPLGSGLGTTTTLNVGVQSDGTSSIKVALADVRRRLDAIHVAVLRAGIPDSRISEQSLNVWANGGPKVESSNVNGNLSITIDDPGNIDRVIGAAVDAGASNLNLWSNGGVNAATPTDAQLRDAITKATAAARSMAQAEAQGAGLTLGALRAVVAQPPSVCPWAPGGPQLVVAVTASYTVK
jgi:uncharacterized protein YggE